MMATSLRTTVRINRDKLVEVFTNLSKDDLVAVAEEVAALEQRMRLAGPNNDDELHKWVVDNLGIDIPRMAVCDNHVSPFQFFSDVYFERVSSALVMANRGGSKTFLVAILHIINSLFRPHCESCSVGAIEAQALRCYHHMVKLLEKNEALRSGIASMIMRETKWKNGSRVEVLPGTMAAVNGPHPQKVHFDEVELADETVFDESRNMSLSGNGIAAQDIITSTRKGSMGLMQRLIDEINDAKSNGNRPPYELYSWCVYESAMKVPNCRVANPNHPSPCRCDKIVKGRWDNGQHRRFVDVCNGRLVRSSGWIPLTDLHKTFMADSRDMWESQQECQKPSTEGLVLPRWRVERYGIRGYYPDPANGPIFAGIDFGGTNPHAVVWFQHLYHEIEATSIHRNPIRLPEGAIVAFDELYVAEIGNYRLADMIVQRERRWAMRFPGFRVARRFADPQGKAARLDLIHHEPSVKTSFYTTRDVKEHIKVLVNLVDDERLFVDTNRCKMWLEEVGFWHFPAKKSGMLDDPDKPVEDFDHCMAASRYGICNYLHMAKRTGITTRGGPRPGAASPGRVRSLVGVASAPRYMGSEAPDWRTAIRP
jgi:hypothetical protein